LKPLVHRNTLPSPGYFMERLEVACFTDCSKLQTSGSPTTSWGGLNHLNGVAATLRGDTYTLPMEVVTSGAITLDEPVSTLEAGLPFAPVLETLPMEVQLPEGFTKAERSLLVDNDGQVYRPAFREFGEMVLNSPVPLFSGFKTIRMRGYKRRVLLKLSQDEPQELTVLSLATEIGV
jgi:hypothetical protein